MDKLERIGHLLVTALVKARELSELKLDAETKQKIRELMKTAKVASRKIEALTKVAAKNGKLDKATVDSALDRILAAMKSVNEELDSLLAKARK
jgi:hypothetical protein